MNKGGNYDAAKPFESSALATRILTSMPVTERDTTMSIVYVTKLRIDQIKSQHATIHKKHDLEASSASISVGIDNFNFIISFMHARNACRSAINIEISGATLNQIITTISTGTKPKMKYAHDATAPSH